MSQSVRPDAPAVGVWIPNDASFGARLALIRHRMGWNAKEAALACGIPQQSWRSWEGGVMPHGGRYFEICAKIAAAAECDYGWLVDRRPSGDWKPSLPKIRPNLRSVQGEGRDQMPRTPLLHPLPTAH